jgi:hypothetical protein
MRSFLQLSALSLVLLQPLVAGLSVPRYFQTAPFTRRDLSVTKVQRELGALVSQGSTIFGPNDARYPEATERYSTHAVPDIEVVVIPATESDVSVIVGIAMNYTDSHLLKLAQVEYCNDNSIDFFAINRAHSRTYSVGAFAGLMIDMTQLTNIEMQPGGKSAWFQGGTYDGQVTKFLWDQGYVASKFIYFIRPSIIDCETTGFLIFMQSDRKL